MSKGRGFVMSGGTYQGEEVQGRGAKAYAPRVPGHLIIRPLSGPCGGAYAIRPYNRVPYSSGNVMSGLPSPPGLGGWGG